MKKWRAALPTWLGLVALGLMSLFPSGEAGAPTAGSVAVKPTGELRIASAFLGAQRLIPWAEVASGGIKSKPVRAQMGAGPGLEPGTPAL